MKLSETFEEALLYSLRIHNNQSRKGTDIPYMAHLMAVASLVLEDGGDEELAIAALLHDAVEDQGGVTVLNEIRMRFGERIARIVQDCSDSMEYPKPPWFERKKRYLEHLKNTTRDVRIVSLADKLHNARSILSDLRKIGRGTMLRFQGGEAGTLWYYKSLVEIFRLNYDSPMVDELALVVDEISKYLDDQQ